jgi:hypothetical protein
MTPEWHTPQRTYTMSQRPVCEGLKAGLHRAATCTFDLDTFTEIRRRAQDSGISFAEMVRRIVAKGMPA